MNRPIAPGILNERPKKRHPLAARSKVLFFAPSRTHKFYGDGLTSLAMAAMLGEAIARNNYFQPLSYHWKKNAVKQHQNSPNQDLVTWSLRFVIDSLRFSPISMSFGKAKEIALTTHPKVFREILKLPADRFVALILDNEVTVGEFVTTPPLSWTRLVATGRHLPGRGRLSDCFDGGASQVRNEKLGRGVVARHQPGVGGTRRLGGLRGLRK